MRDRGNDYMCITSSESSSSSSSSSSNFCAGRAGVLRIVPSISTFFLHSWRETFDLASSDVVRKM